jgi:three-Cys-motif partner protein
MADYARRGGADTLYYIDGFAGPGYYEPDQEGSPIIAIKSLTEHVLWEKLNDFQYWFFFVEKNAKNVQKLQSVLNGISMPSNVRYEVIKSPFDAAIEGILEMARNARAPIFVFIDPFGPTGFPMRLVRRILEYRSSEVLITLNLKAILRFWSGKREVHPKEDIDDLFGTPEWRSIVKDKQDAERREIRLLKLYHNQLEQYTTNLRIIDFRMVNRFDQTSYYLIFCTHSRHGLRVMKEAMWKVDPKGEFQYSDITDPQRPPFLFDPSQDYAQKLASELRDRYAGRQVPYQKLKTFIDDHPCYLRHHLTEALGYLVDQGEVQASRRRAGKGWPEDTIFSFPL